MRVVIVDNDVAQSARDIVRELAPTFRELRYVCEPVANVSLARNRALALARGQFAAFIDDDEIADADWLQNLLDAQHRYQSPIVFGPVVPRMPEQAAGWLRRGGFFERPRLASGAKPTSGATGNVLLEVGAVRATSITFDTAYGSSGGEDADFFHRLSLAGLSGVWCDEALVCEQVGVERVSVRWLWRRAFSGGRNFARIFDGHIAGVRRITSLTLHGLAFLCFAAISVAAICAGASTAMRVSQRALRHLGRAAGLCTIRSWQLARQSNHAV
jgi:succinoglycan biosynthesis protein ExoM